MISGTVDSGYRGEYKAIIHNMMDMPYHVQPYEKIAQLVIVPIADIDELELVQELTPSERGNKGYGSSGK
jgi:dUTP pyrophosphatase